MVKPKSVRREEAEARHKEYLQLNPKQKLARLDSRLGTGQGARKERSKLHDVKK